MLPIFGGVDFDAVIESYAKGNRVNFPALAYFDFRDTPLSVWGGEYDLVAGGVTWTGLGRPGRLISIDGLEAASTLEAGQFTITLSGTDAAMMSVVADEDRGDYVGRLLGVYGLFCDADWQPLTSPFALTAGIMGTMSVSRSADAEKTTRIITLPVDNIFFGRSGSPASFYTDRDQQQRYPSGGDTGLTFIPALQDTDIPVPWH